MSKIQTILSLLLLLVIVFSIDMIFGNPIRESFRGGGGGGGGGLGLRDGGLRDGGLRDGGLRDGLGIKGHLALNNNINTGPITTNDVPLYYFEQSDDEPLFFNWFKRF